MRNKAANKQTNKKESGEKYKERKKNATRGCVISKTFVQCVCRFFYSVDCVIRQIPKDIPLFAYINKTSEYIAMGMSSREKRETEKNGQN